MQGLQFSIITQYTNDTTKYTNINNVSNIKNTNIVTAIKLANGIENKIKNNTNANKEANTIPLPKQHTHLLKSLEWCVNAYTATITMPIKAAATNIREKGKIPSNPGNKPKKNKTANKAASRIPKTIAKHKNIGDVLHI